MPEYSYADLLAYQSATHFLMNTARDIIFIYDHRLKVLHVSDYCATELGMDREIQNPFACQRIMELFDIDFLRRLKTQVYETTRQSPDAQMDCEVLVNGKPRWFRCLIRSFWNGDEYTGFIGRMADVSETYESISQKRDSVLQFAMAPYLAGDVEGSYVMTWQEVGQLMQYLQFVFDEVHLNEEGTDREYAVRKDGALIELPEPCYRRKGRNTRCENCIADQTVSKGGRVTKFEFSDSDIFYVVGLYIIIDGHPYTLLMQTRVDNETLIAGSGQRELVESISRHNTKLYIDTLTDIYNRRYYDENLRAVGNTSAVAMMDIDGFKMINDTRGHDTGDVALKNFARVLLSCVRSTSDAVIRYGGDEFVIVFRDIPEDVFARKLEIIRERVETLVIPECPDLRLTASIGGYYGSGRTANLVAEADRLMYEAKKTRNAVCTNARADG